MKKALVIGIDRYHNQSWNLQGCALDATLFAGMLQDHYQFLHDNIRLLLDERATKENIETRLKWLIKDSQPGDVLVLFNASHGAQIVDRNNDELNDHLDELLVTTDHIWDNPLSDDILSSYFTQVPDGVNLTIVFDNCNAGSGTRGFSNVRYLQPPQDIMFRERGLILPTRSLQNIPDMNHIFMSACRDDQQAQEKKIDRQVRGIFSYYLQEVLKDNDWNITYKEAHEKVVGILKEYKYQQEPQLEGKLEDFDHVIFSSFSE